MALKEPKIEQLVSMEESLEVELDFQPTNFVVSRKYLGTAARSMWIALTWMFPLKYSRPGFEFQLSLGSEANYWNQTLVWEITGMKRAGTLAPLKTSQAPKQTGYYWRSHSDLAEVARQANYLSLTTLTLSTMFRKYSLAQTTTGKIWVLSPVQLALGLGL